MDFLTRNFSQKDEMEPQQPDVNGPYEEVYKDSSTFLKVENYFRTIVRVLYVQKIWTKKFLLVHLVFKNHALFRDVGGTTEQCSLNLPGLSTVKMKLIHCSHLCIVPGNTEPEST